MNRRQLLAGMTAATPAFALLGSDGKESRKKGWAGADDRYHQQFGVHWFYNWTPGGRIGGEKEFVPMIKKEADLKKGKAILDNEKAKVLLGFNEPEREKQGNVSVAKALELWPRLETIAKQRNLRIGSPAPSSNQAGMQWLAQFMKRAEDKGLKIDFIAVHWYRGTDAGKFEQFVDDLADKYDRPIWITEFNGWAGSENEHYRFLKDSLKFLEKSKEVERYAYFNVKAGKAHSLVKGDGSLTRMGELYQEAGTK
ncbi:glycoside hydrolase family protein [Akkermansiaceae bacterium]|nr:glycoside hydrolase family protein [Akkermansiaceae bacterium]